MKCILENDFYFDLELIFWMDIIFFCFLNNLIGLIVLRKQLEDLVVFVKKNGFIIVFDVVYLMYISDDFLRIIYEILGVREVINFFYL